MIVPFADFGIPPMATDGLLLAVTWIWHFLMGTALFLVTAFMILLIMVQKGRGGGLAGALGGMGGDSALGTKAGDTFTRVTVVTAIVWILLCIATTKTFNPQVKTNAATNGMSQGTNGAADTPDGSSTDAPSTDTPSTDAPSTDAPSTDAPGTDAPATETPATETPATETPASETPTSETPTSETPATGASDQ